MYGTTLFGGDNHSFYCYNGCGIVYDIVQRDSSWVFTPLHDIKDFLQSDGATLIGGLSGHLRRKKETGGVYSLPREMFVSCQGADEGCRQSSSQPVPGRNEGS